MELKRVLVVVLAAGFLVSLTWLGASLFTGSKTIAAAIPGQRWEYMVVAMEKKNVWSNQPMWSDKPAKAKGMPFIVESLTSENALDEAGRVGWELVTVVEELEVYQEFVFKRPLP
ncbi:MAG: hypothetical protein AB7V19_02105 [Candidatus Bipolaricaulia bacterium]